MEKKSPGKYILVFEPKYAYHQFAVYFNDDQVQITQIKKFTDLSFEKEKPVKKNLLGDIDKKMTSCSDLNEFFKKYINPSVFSYYGYNLHNMFIAYKSNGKLHTLNYSINNPQLNAKLDFVKGSKFTDISAIRSLIDFAVDPSENNKFLTFVSECKDKYQTGLTNETNTMLHELRGCKKAKENYSDSGALRSSIYLTDALIDKLTSYKEYRELYLLKQSYQEKLNMEKRAFKGIKEALLLKEKTFSDTKNIPEYEQLTLFGEAVPVPYPKTKKKH